MKNIPYYLIITAIGLCSACGNADKSAEHETDSTSYTSDTVIGKTDHAVDLDTTDVMFLKNAAYGGLVEVETSHKIIQATTRPDVKGLAEMIIKDHDSANVALKALAEGKGYRLPKALPDAKTTIINKIDTYKNEWKDEFYVQLMVKEHQEAIDLFTAASKSADKEISGFASQILPALKVHYKHTLKVDSALKVPRANQGDDILKLSDRNKNKQ